MPIPLSSGSQRFKLLPKPPEGCRRTIAGSLSVPGRGIRNSPASVTGVPSFAPSKICLSLSVILGKACTSRRATWASVGSPDTTSSEAMLAAAARILWQQNFVMCSLLNTFADVMKALVEACRWRVGGLRVPLGMHRPKDYLKLYGKRSGDRKAARQL